MCTKQAHVFAVSKYTCSAKCHDKEQKKRLSQVHVFKEIEVSKVYIIAVVECPGEVQKESQVRWCSQMAVGTKECLNGLVLHMGEMRPW